MYQEPDMILRFFWYMPSYLNFPFISFHIFLVFLALDNRKYSLLFYFKLLS